MKTLNSILIILCLSLFSACATDDECEVDADCSDGDTCSEDRCRLGRCSALLIPGCCHDDADCGPSFGPRCEKASSLCVACIEDADCLEGTCDEASFRCVTPKAGAACTSDAECDSGWCLQEASTGYPHGFCGKACQSPEDCESLACVEVAGGEKSCLPVCFSDAECRPAYMCLGVGADRGACFPHCTQASDCPVVGTCNPWLGLCSGSVPGAENGAPCENDADCKGYCATEASNGAPGGVCFSICSPSRVACPGEDEACSWLISPFLGAIHICQPVFVPADGCRPEYAPMVAIEFLVGVDPQAIGVCQPACRAGDCGNADCNLYSGLCGDPVAGAEHGAACVTNEECKGICLTFWPDGYCTGPCHLADPQCEGGAYCMNLGIQTSCTSSCQSDPDCREDYFCEPNVHTCIPPG